MAILGELSSYILEASKSMFATRFIQNKIELSSENEKFIDVIVQGLKPHVLDICFNCNGRHVIQTCLKRFPVDRCGPMLEIALEHCKGLSLNRKGCCVIQSCLELERDMGT